MVTWLLRCYIKPNWQAAAVVSFSDFLARMVQETLFSLKMRPLGAAGKPQEAFSNQLSNVCVLQNHTLKLACICNILEC